MDIDCGEKGIVGVLEVEGEYVLDGEAVFIPGCIICKATNVSLFLNALRFKRSLTITVEIWSFWTG